MSRNYDYYNDLLNNHVKNLLPFSDVLKAEDLLFISPDRKVWILQIHGRQAYQVHFIRNFNEVWAVRTGDMKNGLKALMIFDRITAEQAERLRQNNIEFLDRKGNVFLKLTKLYLFAAGRNKSASGNDYSLTGKPDPGSKLFKIAGVKLIYVLLSDPELDSIPSDSLLNSNFRVLAGTAKISLGSISDIMWEMKEHGYLLEEKGRRYLLNRKELFRKWLSGFMDYRPRWNVVRLESASPDWWKKANLRHTDIFWGGETAASILTKGFLTPEKATLYTDKIIYNFVLEHGLRKVASGGNVELMAPLPGRPSLIRDDCVHPLLVYADLIYSGNDRSREAADRIYDIYLKKIIEPN